MGAEDVSQRQRLTGVVTKVDPNATVPNGASNDIANNNDTIAPSITATTTTSSPDITTVDTTTTVQSANNSLASLGAENSTDGSPETITTVQIPANPDTNGRETTPVPTSEIPGTTVPVNAITNTPPPSTTTETATSTSVADITLAAESSTESVSNDVQSTELSTKTTEVATLLITETVNARISMPASQNLQTANDTSDTTIPSPITESVTVMHLPPEATTILAMNDTSESIETNTVQQSEETTPRLTETTITIENIETNTIQQSDTTDPSQTTEITSTTESTTTEDISNDVIEIRATAVPAFSSTYRTRLVDYAQNILSLLSQKEVTTINTPVQRPTVTTTVSPEMSNTIPDSSSTNTESPAQPEETTTMRIAGSGNDETTESFDVEFVSITTDGSEETNRNTVGVNTTLQGQSNDQGINAQNTLDSNTTTEQTFSSTVGNERNTTSDPESTMATQDARAPTMDGEVATTTLTPTSRLIESVTENDPRSSNDTLLAELMTIAKTLFTEAMNDTRQLGQTDGTVGNDRNRTVFVLNSASEATTAPSELSKPLENTTERIDITTLIDLAENERGDNSTRDPVVGSNISLVESNARPTNVDDVTTMPLSQMETGTSNITTVTASMSSELTTNTPDSQLFNSIESSSNNTEQQTITTVSNNETQLLNRLLEFATNNPLASSVTVNTEGMLSTSDVNNSTTSDMVTELTTSVAMMEINVVQTNAVDTTNQTPVPTTIMPVSDLQVTNDQSLIASDITTILPMVSDTSDTQPFDTESPITESIRNLVSFTDTTTNQLNDITTNTPQTLTDLVSEMPNFIARLQDTTTAQGTAGSRIIQPEQTTETIITTTVPNITSSTALTTDSTTSPVSSTNASTIPSSSVESTIATTTTETTTTTSTTFRTTSTETSRSDLTTTVESTSEMTITTADINDNLVSTETTTDISTTRGTTTVPTESEDLNMISRINDGEGTTTATTTTTSVAPPTNGTNNTSSTSTTARTTMLNRVSSFPASTPFQPGPYLGRFGGSQMTPLPRPSSSKAPVRDYLIYGIYPNKTIVRKRPEDNVIDGRNVDSPYVIFGIYPDGRLVRKFPNGTIIPESPRNPVEVVFTLRTTTTTNRPAPRPYYNQANQAGVYNNQYQAPVYYNNGRPVDDLTRDAQNPGSFDFGLIGNAIGVTPGGPNFTGPFGPPASIPSTNKMVSLSHLFIKIILYTCNEFDQESNRN